MAESNKKKTSTAASQKKKTEKTKTNQSGKNTKHTQTTKKNTSSPKSASASSRRRETAIEEHNQTRMHIVPNKKNGIVSQGEEIAIWVMLAFCIVLTLSNFFGIGGVFGKYISYFFFGMFGAIAYILPLIMFIATAFIAVNRKSRKLLGKILSFLLIMVTVSCFFEMVMNDFDRTRSLMFYYHNGAEIRTGGGLIGGTLTYCLCSAFGKIAGVICDLIFFLIALVAFTGKSAIGGIYENGKKIVDSYQTKNTDKYNSGYGSAEKREPRRNRVHQGVSLNTTLDRNSSDLEDVHEVIPHAGKDTEKRVVAGSNTKLDLKIGDSDKPSRAKKMVEEFDNGDKPIVQQSFTIQGIALEENEPADPVVDEEPVIKKGLKNAKSSKQEQEQEKNLVEEEIKQNEKTPKKEYIFPPVRLLGYGNNKKNRNMNTEIKETAAKLQSTLESFGVNVSINNVSCGPAVTRYELTPEQGVKVSKIVNLSDDIKLNLAASDIRIEAPIPGKSAIGIEVPNKENSAVYFRELIETENFSLAKSNLTFAVGKDIAGQPVIADIARMPHLLIAGATGSGKSVCINTLIMSILYKANPEDVKLIMIDPKVVELSVYNGIPHLMIPVVTDPKKASGALNWAVAEMTRRYELFSTVGVRDLAGYNRKVEQIPEETEGKPDKLPQIVIIVDELADLMMVAPGEVEDAICRLAQLARAAGLHLIIATQRPSVNVITGLIKANMPSRIAFSVTSGVDSRTILDMNGAEKLLGKGDMLFYPQGYPKPIRVQGAFVTDEEVGKVTDFLKEQLDEETFGKQEVIDIDKFQSVSTGSQGTAADNGSDRDPYFMEAGKFIIEKDKASIGMLQRVFKIGFNRAARIMDQLADAGVVGPEEGTKPRKILMSMEEFEQYVDEYV